MCQPKWLPLLLTIILIQIPSSMAAPPPRDFNAMDIGLQLMPVDNQLNFLPDSMPDAEFPQDQKSFGYVSHTREKRQIEFSDESLFRAYARNGDLKVVKLFHIQGLVDVNSQSDTNWTALMWASRFGHDDVVEYLLENGANPNLQNDHEDTAILWAMGAGHDIIIEMLCKHHADPNIPEAAGLSTISVAASMNRQEELRIIDKHCMPFDLDHVDDNGRTPVNLAAKYGQATMVILLGYHNNIDIADNYKMTPLHWSVLLVDTSTLQAVLLFCPDLTLRDLRGNTALDIAKLVGNTNGAKIIEDVISHPSEGCQLGNEVLPNLLYIFFDCKQMQCMCSGYWRQTGVRDPDCVKVQVNVLSRQEVENSGHNVTAPPMMGPYIVEEEEDHHHHE